MPLADPTSLFNPIHLHNRFQVSNPTLQWIWNHFSKQPKTRRKLYLIMDQEQRPITDRSWSSMQKIPMCFLFNLHRDPSSPPLHHHLPNSQRPLSPSKKLQQVSILFHLTPRFFVDSDVKYFPKVPTFFPLGVGTIV